MLYRVRMDVHDDSFVLAIQGQMVDAWSEPERVGLAAVGRSRQRDGEVGDELRPGEATGLVVRVQAVARHSQ